MSNGSFGSLDVSASALSAERLRMNVIAGNLANAHVLQTPEGGPYRRRQVVFEEVLDRASASLDPSIARGVKAKVEVDNVTPFGQRPDPSSPSGVVSTPNVNPMFEMVDLLTAARAYEANLTALRSYREMLQKTLMIGK